MQYCHISYWKFTDKWTITTQTHFVQRSTIHSFQLSEQLIWKVLSQFAKKVCQSSLTMPSSSPPNVFKTLNYLKEKEEDGWININPICETTQPPVKWILNSHESATRKMWFCLYKSYLYILQKWLVLWNNSTLNLTNSALLLNTCQVSTTGQGWITLGETGKKNWSFITEGMH